MSEQKCERASELHPAAGPRVPGDPRRGGGRQDGPLHPGDPRPGPDHGDGQRFPSAVTTSPRSEGLIEELLLSTVTLNITFLLEWVLL